MKEFLLGIWSLIATGFIYLMGGLDIAMISLLIIMIIDYITGISSAIYNKKLSSKIGFKGIMKKILMLCLVALSVVIDRLTGESGAIRTLVIYYYVGNEGLSILENLIECNIPFPEKVIEVLDNIKKEK